jgi:hydrogenase expression/formation protein HypC
MCLGTIGQITGVGAHPPCVQILAGDREITGSLLAISETLRPGDWVLVHSGLVLARLTEDEARDALEIREPSCEAAP